VEESDGILEQVGELVGNPTRSKLVTTIRDKMGSGVKALEYKVDKLTYELVKAKSRAIEAEKNCKSALLQANASAAALVQVEDALKLPADVVMKARVLDANLEKDGHLSSKRVVEFMMEQSSTIQEAYQAMQVLVGNLTHVLPKFSEQSESSSDDDSADSSDTEAGEALQAGRTPVGTGSEVVHLISSPEVATGARRQANL
jgi:hypothetical protein